MNDKEPCSICGCTQTELVDGFYYCTECGTQDANVRETLVEYTTLGDGLIALGSRKRIKQIPKGHEVEMTDDWYKWHCINYLLKGLADELIELGVAPSFKTKLLWVWARYMKKYQNRADFGLANEESEDDDDDIPAKTDKPYSSDEEDEEEKNSVLHRKGFALYGSITKMSMPLIITFLYVALNIDKSPIQLSHLFRFMREGRVSILQWQTLVPQELRPKILKRCLLYDFNCFRYSSTVVRKLALQMFRDLDLGNPIVPDLRLLIDEYLQELCLPNDIKPLVISLIHYRSFDYLDINVEYKDLHNVPSYELYVMAHILMALKMCFSLDGQYEHDLSDAVDKINDMENQPKSYNAEPTERLFSFKDWCSYIIFRKTMLRTHTLHLGAPHYFDMDDYVAFEHQRDKPDYKVNLKDEIALDILKKIPRNELNVIPRSEFVATKTPHKDYTRKIIEHQQDPEVIELLSEDFTQYSLEYILKDMFLVDPDSETPKNIITGTCERNLINCSSLFNIKNDEKPVYPKRMVYVKDCDNHNWMTTLRPRLEHVTKASNNGDSDEKENDHGYETNSESSQPKASSISLDNTSKSVTEPTVNGSVLANDNGMLHLKIEDGEIIREEDECENIFDDNFAGLDAKIEEEKEPECNDNGTRCTSTENFDIHNAIRYNELTQAYRSGDRDSDASSEDSIGISPETLDRNEAIKKLVLHACNKLKVSIPGQYIHKTRKVPIRRPPYYGPAPKRARVKGLITQKINNLIASYYAHMQNDILHQMSNMVQSAIADFNKTKESEMHVDLEDPPPVDAETEVANDQTMETEQNDPNEEPELNETVADDEYKLFGDSSDGETHAEDLLPKKNPKFDEETHDSSQLYIRPVENPGVPEMRLNPNLFRIIEKQLNADKNELNITDKEITRSDSEEDLSLSTLQEQKRIRKKLKEQAELTKARHLKPLIHPKTIPPYKYWMRHYESYVTASSSLNQRYTHETDMVLPKSFALVLKECADVVGYPPFVLYKNLQRVELCLKDRFLNRSWFKPNYISVCKMGRICLERL